MSIQKFLKTGYDDLVSEYFELSENEKKHFDNLIAALKRESNIFKPVSFKEFLSYEKLVKMLVLDEYDTDDQKNGFSGIKFDINEEEITGFGNYDFVNLPDTKKYKFPGQIGETYVDIYYSRGKYDQRIDDEESDGIYENILFVVFYTEDGFVVNVWNNIHMIFINYYVNEPDIYQDILKSKKTVYIRDVINKIISKSKGQKVVEFKHKKSDDNLEWNNTFTIFRISGIITDSKYIGNGELNDKI